MSAQMCALARAQLVTNYNPPRSSCCLADTAKRLSDQMQDWNQLSRYHAANEELKKQPADPKRIVFLGDSITDFWKLGESFPGKPYMNRGIGGQTTPQMLVRMFPDVVDLKPAAIVILAGTNDIAQNTGPETATMVEENLMAITELAQKHGIKVILWECLVIDGERKRGVEAKSQGDWFVRVVGVINDHLIEKFGNGKAELRKLDTRLNR
jgi:hypothetical protein